MDLLIAQNLITKKCAFELTFYTYIINYLDDNGVHPIMALVCTLNNASWIENHKYNHVMRIQRPSTRVWSMSVFIPREGLKHENHKYNHVTVL